MVVCPGPYPWYQFFHSNVAIPSLSACRYISQKKGKMLQCQCVFYSSKVLILSFFSRAQPSLFSNPLLRRTHFFSSKKLYTQGQVSTAKAQRKLNNEPETPELFPGFQQVAQCRAFGCHLEPYRVGKKWLFKFI